ncbi:tRNA (adenosine(37)-N6)-threonylcarbamoyltransferase complex dimerization subunit type 1 TsaB [Aquimarina spongiae]|uniref:tRNA threonylcarbamoyladenosine biosynthesis protein TsaB n=1 Tax=Aquimarina spongiae TaxID=570521 RepID=A0A1M6E7U9_9FLAO|nr:tRNA (adenosine(37)-N6)-threonylcarbamoyltransferase complex dimerization subunit type 1 TsaB [Aquimarina spongiae]SHI81557.1 tRNA threonylcarbamoyladenosine biosynthesis protein TsaB [Aquimarina spongiae]
MSYLLCIETSTTNCSVAITNHERIIALSEDYNDSYSHAERLHVFIKEVIASAGITMRDIAAVAVSKGPGSYTGLRIGVSAAKGLCYALDIPLISVPTLLSLSKQVEAKIGEFIIPMLDARRMEVYASVFSSDYEVVRKTNAEILDASSFSEYLEQGKVHFIGNGVEKFSKICEHPNAIFISKKLPSANEMATVVYSKFSSGSFEDVSYFEPYYLKDFVAG